MLARFVEVNAAHDEIAAQQPGRLAIHRDSQSGSNRSFSKRTVGDWLLAFNTMCFGA